MRRKAVIIGSGGHARVIASILKAKLIPCLGCFDDSFTGEKEMIGAGAVLMGRLSDLKSYQNQIDSAYLAVGDNAKRAALFKSLSAMHFRLPVLIHPKALIEKDARINDASVVCIGAIVGTQATVGRGCIINSGCSLDHESRLGNFVHVAPRAAIAGRTIVGDNVFIGINATIAGKLIIGKNAVVGAGAVVLKDVSNGKTVVGVYH